MKQGMHAEIFKKEEGRDKSVGYDKESFLAGLAVGRLLGPRDEGGIR